jgi:carbon-monoxide dehydrogenase medium subunit
MKPAPFAYHRPRSLGQALALLEEHGMDASPLAGGQSLVPMLNFRMARPDHLIDLNGISELDGISIGADWIEIGAMTRHHRVATSAELRTHLPLLVTAVGTIGHYAIRQRGTMGGSLVQADPAGQIPLVAMALDAEIVVQSTSGERRIPVVDFLVFSMDVDLEEGELVTAVRFPRQRPDSRWAFELFSRRHGDYALASVALSFGLDRAGAVTGLRVAIGATGPVPHRLPVLEAAQEGTVPDADWCARLAGQIAEAAEAEDGPRMPESYRRELVADLAGRALQTALTRGAA